MSYQYNTGSAVCPSKGQMLFLPLPLVSEVARTVAVHILGQTLSNMI